MAEEDIYKNKDKYEDFTKRYKDLLKPTHKDKNGSTVQVKYFCKKNANLKYYPPLFSRFDTDDVSYIRRLRLLSTMKIITHATSKDLAKCEREDIDKIITFMHARYPSSKSKTDFLKDIKRIWKIILPEKDEKGRIDDTIVPYPVRHLVSKQDASKEKMREDRISPEEYETILHAFTDDSRLQAYIALAFESLGRPQEILNVKLKDVEMHDNYAKLWVIKGKEGGKFLMCIDSYPYLSKWLNKHPLRKDKDAYLFCLLPPPHDQLTSWTINKHLREKLPLAGIKKRITCYSFKRNGVTFRRLRGDSDVIIQHVAGWTSTKQLKTYDKSDQEDVFKQELARRGLIKDDGTGKFKPQSKTCVFCGCINGLADEYCNGCKRPLNRERIVQEAEQKEQRLDELEAKLDALLNTVGAAHSPEIVRAAQVLKNEQKKA